MTPTPNRLNSIRARLGVFLFVVLAAYAGITWYCLERIAIVPSFETLEKENAAQDIRRCVRAIEREIHHLDVIANDWGAWDDTYKFVEDRNQAYIDANLTMQTFIDMRLCLLCAFDMEGRMVWGEGWDIESEERVPVEQLLAFDVNAHLPDPDAENPERESGIVLTRRGPMLVALAPILTSEDEGPARGLLVFGRIVSEEMVSTLREQTEVDFRATAVDRNALRGWEQEVLRECSAPDEHVIQEAGPDRLYAYSVMPDLGGNPALILQADIDRDILRRGLAVARIAFFAMVGAGLVVLLIMVVLLQGSVVRPLLRLANDILQITRGGDWHARLNTRRTDELGVVAREFDQLLDRIEGDILEREKGEAALRASEARTRAIVDASADAIIVCNFEGHVESANTAAHKMFACNAEELVGRDARAFIAGTAEEIQERAMALAAGLQAQNVCRMEMMGRRTDGTTFPIYLSVSEIATGGDRLFVCIVTDMTEYQRMHLRVLRAEHLAMIGEMGASIAHEIRNPLAGISGAVQVLAKSVDAQDSRHEVFTDVLEQVARVEETVNGLLMFARPWTPEQCACDLVEVAMDAARRIARSEEVDGVKFEWALPDALTAHADPELMLQVLTNLYRNAVQAMPEGGRVRVTGESVPDAVRLVIEDEGPGISDEVLKQAFNPFFTTKTRGTGLGLAVCRQIMEAHDGAIAIENGDRGGARVVLTLPRGEG